MTLLSVGPSSGILLIHSSKSIYGLHFYRPHSEGMGKVLFSQVSVCPHSGDTSINLIWGGGGCPIQPGINGGDLHQVGWGYPLSGWTGVHPTFPRPETQQHSEYLLHRGRYASCVHTGGLSCYNWIRPELRLKIVYTH